MQARQNLGFGPVCECGRSFNAGGFFVLEPFLLNAHVQPLKLMSLGHMCSTSQSHQSQLQPATAALVWSGMALAGMASSCGGRVGLGRVSRARFTSRTSGGGRTLSTYVQSIRGPPMRSTVCSGRGELQWRGSPAAGSPNYPCVTAKVGVIWARLTPVACSCLPMLLHA